MAGQCGFDSPEPSRILNFLAGQKGRNGGVTVAFKAAAVELVARLPSLNANIAGIWSAT
jgi:hypothetical protein